MGNVFFPCVPRVAPRSLAALRDRSLSRTHACPVGSSPLPPSGISLQRRQRGQRVKPTPDPARADTDPPGEETAARAARSRLANAARVWRSRCRPHPRAGRGSDPFPQAAPAGAPQSSRHSAPRPLPPGARRHSQRVPADVHHQLQGGVAVLGGLAPRAAQVVHGRLPLSPLLPPRLPPSCAAAKRPRRRPAPPRAFRTRPGLDTAGPSGNEPGRQRLPGGGAGGLSRPQSSGCNRGRGETLAHD